jgi:Ran GTPase-activating protein 1
MALSLIGFTGATLDIRGPRGGLTGARARELGASVLNGERVDYERIVLSSWGFSVEAADVFADIISRLPKLRSAIIADIIAGRPEAEGLAVYRSLGAALRLHALEELDFSDNAVGTKGVEACRDFLTAAQPTLQRIFYCNCGISAEAARSIADVLCANTPTTLRVIHFDNNMSGGGGASAVADIVAASPELVDFRFTSSRGTVEGGVALAKAFLRCLNIEKINLHDNIFTAPSAVLIGSTLRSLSSLRHLDVGDTLVKDSGMAAIAAGLIGTPLLTFLDVSENELSSRGARSLAIAISRLPALEILIAHGNEFGEDGAVALVHALRVTAAEGRHLHEVILGSCEFGSVATVAIIEAVATSPLLRIVDVANNALSAAGIARARAALAKSGHDASKLRLEEGEEEDAGEDEEEEESETSVLLSVVDIEASKDFCATLIKTAEAKAAAAAATTTSSTSAESSSEVDAALSAAVKSLNI